MSISIENISLIVGDEVYLKDISLKFESGSPDKIDTIDIECTQIGIIEEKPGLRVQRGGVTEDIEVKGFEHFS